MNKKKRKLKCPICLEKQDNLMVIATKGGHNFEQKYMCVFCYNEIKDMIFFKVKDLNEWEELNERHERDLEKEAEQA